MFFKDLITYYGTYNHAARRYEFVSIAFYDDFFSNKLHMKNSNNVGYNSAGTVPVQCTKKKLYYGTMKILQ